MTNIEICVAIENKLDDFQRRYVQEHLDAGNEAVKDRRYREAAEAFNTAAFFLDLEREFKARDLINALCYYFKYIVPLDK